MSAAVERRGGVEGAQPGWPGQLNRFNDSLEFGVVHLVVDICDSTPLTNVFMVSVKSAPYVFFADECGLNNWATAFSTRVRYLEVALTAAVSTVYNVALALLFSAGAVLTLGQVKAVNRFAQRFWTQAVLAGVATGVGVVGTISPTLAAKTYEPLLRQIFSQIFAEADRNITSSVRNLFRQYRPQLEGLLSERAMRLIDERLGRAQSTRDLGAICREVNVQEGILNGENVNITNWARNLFRRYRPQIEGLVPEEHQAELRPVMHFIDERLERAQNINDLVALCRDANERFPQIREIFNGVVEGIQEGWNEEGAERPAATRAANDADDE